MRYEKEEEERVMKDMTKRFARILNALKGLPQIEAKTLLCNVSYYISNEAIVKIPKKAPEHYTTMFKAVMEQIKKQRDRDPKEVQ